MKVLNERKIKKRSGINPRKIALLILIQYFKKRGSLKDIINSCLKNYELSKLDRRFIFNIAKGTVRYYQKIDFILSLFSNKDIKDIDFVILNILRMGIFQLIYMSKIPDYSAVNESVQLAKKNAGVSSSKFVNAILRKISSIPDMDSFIEGEIKRVAKDETDRISINYSYPGWLIKYWLDCYGKEKTVLICRSLNENPHTYLRFNKDKIAREELFKELGVKSIDGKYYSQNVKVIHESASDDIETEGDNNEQFVSKHSILEDVIEVSTVQDISGTDVYKKGLVSIQDISSQIAVKYFLNPLGSEKVLDVCAAPGGKTAHIAELVGNDGEVISVDINRKRLKILQDNLKRLDIKNVRIIEADAAGQNFLERSEGAKNKRKPDSYTGYFDKILIDAPCSAFGTISKNPDAKYSKTMDDVIRLSEMSYRMMVNCDTYLKAGGKLVFYTCTLSPTENQQVIGKFLEEFKGKYVIGKQVISDELISVLEHKKIMLGPREKTCLEIMPYYFESEGGFVCSLIKRS